MATLHFYQHIHDSANKLIWLNQQNINDILSGQNTIISNTLYRASDFTIHTGASAYTEYNKLPTKKPNLFRDVRLVYGDPLVVCPCPFTPWLITRGEAWIAIYSFLIQDIITYKDTLERCTGFTGIMHHFMIRYRMTHTTDKDLVSTHLDNLRRDLNAYTVNYLTHKMIPQPPSDFLRIPLLKYQRANIAWMHDNEKSPPSFMCNQRSYIYIGTMSDGVKLYYSSFAGLFCTETSQRHFERDPTRHPIDESRFDIPKITVKGGIIMDDPGLGKTVQMLFTAFADSESTKPTLVIVPDHLVDHWRSEVFKFFVDVSRFAVVDNHMNFTDERLYQNKVILTSVDCMTKYCNLVFGTSQISRFDNLTESQLERSSSRCSSFASKFYQRPESVYMNFSRIIIDEIHELYNSIDGRTDDNIRNPLILTLMQIIKSDFRWACTATPFVVNYAMYYIMGYLCPGEYQISQRIICRHAHIYSTFKNVLRRNTKRSILQEYKFPEIHRTVYQLAISHVERMVYNTEIEGCRDETTLRKMLCALVVNGSGSATTSEIFTNLDELKRAMIKKYTERYDMAKHQFLEYISRMFISYLENILKEMNDETERIDSIDELYAELKKKSLEQRATMEQKTKFNEYEEFYNKFYETRKTFLFMNHKLRELERISEFNDKSEEEQMEEEDDISKCVICMGPVAKSLVVMPCGHITCQECYQDVESRGGLSIDSFHGGGHIYRKCPECSEKCTTTDIKFLSRMAKKKKQESDYIQNFGTKLGNLLLLLKKLKRGEKMVIYTQWNDIITKIFNTIVSSLLPISVFALSRDHTKAISDFKSSTDTSVLILSSETKSAGISLIEADYILLYEPIAGELGRRRELKTQIIGRCHRIGRTRPVNLIEFVVQDTIENQLFHQEQSITIDPNEFIGTDYSLGELYQDDSDEDDEDDDVDDATMASAAAGGMVGRAIARAAAMDEDSDDD